MARIAEHLYELVGSVASHLATNMPRSSVDLGPSDDPMAVALRHALENRGYAAYAYPARSLELLRSFTVLYQHALPAGTHTIARPCIENEAAALIAGFGTPDDFAGLVESSQAWAARHLHHAEGTEVPRELKTATWMPTKLFKRMKATAQAGHYSIVRCEEIEFYHGLLSYLEAHADFALAITARSQIAGVPLAGFSADARAANAAATSTVWAASIGAYAVEVSDDDLQEAVERFETAVPIRMVEVDQRAEGPRSRS